MWENSIGARTHKQYQYAMSLYKTFLVKNNVSQTGDFPPVNENLILNFVSTCVERGLTHSSIKLYLCGIRFYYIEHLGYNPLEISPGFTYPRLATILTGIKKSQGNKTILHRLPITSDILSKIASHLRRLSPHTFTHSLMEASCTVAFFAFLRCGEFTVQKVEDFDPNNNLCCEDLVVRTDHMILTLKKSKTDPFRQGISIPLFQTKEINCPVRSLNQYLQARNYYQANPKDPLFIMENGLPLTRNYFIDNLRSILSNVGFNAKHYHGHSFRIGAATTAAKVRLEDHLIKTLGRWSSDCYTRYIRTPNSSIREAQIALAKLS